MAVARASRARRKAAAGMRSKAGLCAAIRQRRRAALVINTRSRRGRRLYPAVTARLHTAGFGLLGSFAASQARRAGAPAWPPRWTCSPTC